MDLQDAFVGLLAAIIGLSTQTQPASADETRIYCGQDDAHPATIVDAPGYAPFALIVWNQAPGVDFDEYYTPQRRCDIVSTKAQYHWDNGTLGGFTTGVENNLPVICVAAEYGGPCAGTLFTLRQNANASQTLKELFSAYHYGDTIYQSDSLVPPQQSSDASQTIEEMFAADRDNPNTSQADDPDYISFQDILESSTVAVPEDTSASPDLLSPQPAPTAPNSICPGPLCRE